MIFHLISTFVCSVRFGAGPRFLLQGPALHLVPRKPQKQGTGQGEKKIDPRPTVQGGATSGISLIVYVLCQCYKFAHMPSLENLNTECERYNSQPKLPGNKAKAKGKTAKHLANLDFTVRNACLVIKASLRSSTNPPIARGNGKSFMEIHIVGV